MLQDKKLRAIEGSGTFELKLKTFFNAEGKDNQNLCCSGRQDPATGKCIGTCKTRFRVCLKHYQAKIDTTSPCTFGDVSTQILGDNNVDLTQQGNSYNSYNTNNTSVNPIQFPFDFTWPVSLHLISYHFTFK
uniref:CSON008748 protein n=1 Tax=Culicoides sonorensis TaxID=179676 RepID=A0A336LFP9_CULSO